ncbi:MAG TPA: heparan-alpha-glucosaminide N-acetyltransferase domain-containing protein, partial [Burkholderiaceae bacterium]|nr:heparan-alpha-glucosaminide N-acetyltransferase domain-containing protein [Burkholderiaceae bacterium]
PALGATDAAATVSGEQHDLAIRLVATTVLPGEILRQRLRLLAGQRWVSADPSPLAGPLPRWAQPLATLGRWSLSYYMLHQPVLIGLLLAWRRLGG